MNKLNIFWFIIDSVRTYKTGQDDRDRLDIMDEFAQNGIEFTNCFTSAPSSLLAAGAIFTGLPSIFIARHFNDWKFKDNNLSIVTTLVEEYNYLSFPLLNAREEREKYQFLLSKFESNYLPSKYRLSNYGWRNWEITEIFEHIMDNNEFEKPVIFTFWYDCRRDPNTSMYVKQAIQKIKDKGLFENSIILMHSDHGYPDPSTTLNEGFFRNYGHDMVLTDDNIRTPLIIKYPGGLKNIKINNVVGHVDILPTIFDILRLPYKTVNTQFQGKSVMPIIRGEESDSRIRRTDTRLTMDTGKIVSLRSERYKYLNFYDDGSEILIDIKKDKHETNNISRSNIGKVNNILAMFRQLRDKYDKDIYEYHKNTLISNANKNFKFISKNSKILVISSAPEQLLKILFEVLSKKSSIIDIIYSGDAQNKKDIGFSCSIYVEKFDKHEFDKNNIPDYDLILYLTENSRRVFLKPDAHKALKGLKSKKHVLLNYNFETFNYFYSRWLGTAVIKLFFDWEVKGYFYKQEPIYFIKDLWFFIKHIFTKLLIKNSYNDDLNAAKEIMEYRKHQITGNAIGLNEMDSFEMEKEFGRIKTREG